MSPPRLAVTAVFILNGALFGVWASRVPAFVDRFSLTPDRLGLLLLFIAGGAVLAFPLAGRLSDRIGPATVTRFVLPFYALAFLLVSAAPGVVSLAVALALFGAVYGAMDVSMNGWAAEVEAALGRPVMSSFHAAYSLGAGLGAGTGVLAAGMEIGPFVHFAAVALPATLVGWRLSSVPWTSVRQPPGPTFALPKGALILVGLVAMGSGVGEGAMADWSAVFLTQVTGVDASRGALGYAAFSVAMVAMRLMGDRLTARLGPVLFARVSGISAATGIAVLILAPGLGAALAGFCLLGVGYAALFPLAMSRAAADPDTSPGRAIAGVATLGYGGMLLGPPVIGWVASVWSLPAGISLVGVLALLVVALAGALGR